MQQLILKLPDSLAEQLAVKAAAEQKTIEQLALERLCYAFKPDRGDLARRYEQFVKSRGLHYQFKAEEEAMQIEPYSDEELEQVAAKLGAAGPLSEVIIEERRQGY